MVYEKLEIKIETHFINCIVGLFSAINSFVGDINPQPYKFTTPDFYKSTVVILVFTRAILVLAKS
jgi:hypothetical protein